MEKTAQIGLFSLSQLVTNSFDEVEIFSYTVFTYFSLILFSGGQFLHYRPLSILLVNIYVQLSLTRTTPL